MTSAAVDTEAVAVETRAASRPRRRKRRAKPSRVALHAFLILTVLVWASPILWAIFTAMRPYSDTSEHGYVSWPRAFNFTNFTNAYTQSGMLHYFWNSIIVAVPAIFVILLFSSALATLEFTFIYNDFLWALILAPSSDVQPITAALNNLQGQFFTDNNLLAAGALLTAVPTLVVFVLLQKQFVRGLTLGANKG